VSDIAGQRIGPIRIDADVAARIREESARHWKLLLAIGLLCEITGVFSIVVPIVASISAAVLVGWALLFAGVIQLGHIVRRKLAWDWEVLWRLLVAVLTIVAGAWILIAPLTGTITLTVVLVVWLWAIGVTRLLAWWRMLGMEHNWLNALSGAASLILGILIWADLPSSATWAIGLLVGIELLFAGAGLIMAAMAGRQLARTR
jgi:uncharacterized membrane protein HdeD (DUF308 family)